MSFVLKDLKPLECPSRVPARRQDCGKYTTKAERKNMRKKPTLRKNVKEERKRYQEFLIDHAANQDFVQSVQDILSKRTFVGKLKSYLLAMKSWCGNGLAAWDIWATVRALQGPGDIAQLLPGMKQMCEEAVGQVIAAMSQSTWQATFENLANTASSAMPVTESVYTATTFLSGMTSVTTLGAALAAHHKSMASDTALQAEVGKMKMNERQRFVTDFAHVMRSVQRDPSLGSMFAQVVADQQKQVKDNADEVSDKDGSDEEVDEAGSDELEESARLLEDERS